MFHKDIHQGCVSWLYRPSHQVLASEGSGQAGLLTLVPTFQLLHGQEL